MSWADAPLYVEAHDLARWVIERTDAWSARAPSTLARRVAGAACDLLCGVSLALTFPERRARHLERADQAIVRLRVLLRLACALGGLSAGGLRHAAGRLQVIGRMVGGWRKRVARRDGRRPGAVETDPFSGDGPPAARGA